MTKIIEAMQEGKIVKHIAVIPRHYMILDGVLCFTDTPEDGLSWKKSNIKKGTMQYIFIEKEFEIL